ncbi:eukaryotic translation initiation factor 3 subunit H [Trichonephila clavipes]|nr:eukaryotic translation initiation factor 3 subunit H [Trichonephila clavipes]
MAANRKARHADPDCESPIDYVQIDGLVVLKIIKHCHEEGAGVTDVAQGVLLGLGVDNRLEITNCFPYPRHTDEEDFDEMEYQMEMMRHLRHVNVDHLHVGWYQSTHFGSFYNKPLLESQFNYQSSIEESVVLIYDPMRTTRGFLSLRAYRLSNTAMKLYKEGEFTLDMLKNLHVSYSKMFEEITVIIRNSHLVNLLMCEIADWMPSDQESNQFLDMGTASVLEKSLQAMMECVDTVSQETNKLTNHQRQVIKQQQAKNQYLQKRRGNDIYMGKFRRDSKFSKSRDLWGSPGFYWFRPPRTGGTYRKGLVSGGGKLMQYCIHFASSKFSVKGANKIESELKNDVVGLQKISLLQVQLKDKYLRLEAAQEAVSGTLLLLEDNGEEFETDFTDAESYREKYFEYYTHIDKKLGETVISEVPDTPRKFKLPKLELRKFGGDPKEFLSFWSQFQKIREDGSILDEDKMQYLVASVEPKSKVERLILSFPATAANYPKAVDQLKERFGREDLLVQIYIRDLLTMVMKNAVSGRARMDLSRLMSWRES